MLTAWHGARWQKSDSGAITIELPITDQLPEPELRDALAAAEVEIVVAAGLSRLCITGESARPASRARARLPQPVAASREGRKKARSSSA